MTPAQLFYLYVILSGILLVVILSWWLLVRTRRKARLSRELDLVLYEITQPQEASKEAGKSFKDLISVMEQFYVGMSSIAERGWKRWFSGPAYFSLELALPNVGAETTFFAAVSRERARFFEKQIESFFPHAKIITQKNDYNIFNPKGAVAAGYFTVSKNAILPLRIYSKLDVDPLEVIANAFSKMRENGEGASLQLVMTPDDSGFAGKVKDALEHYKRTGKLAVQSSSWIVNFVDFIDHILFGHNHEEKKGETIFDENVAKLLGDKSSRMFFNANIRLVASASTQEEADMVLKELEGAFAQFAEPQGNNFKLVSAKGRDRDKLIYQFIMRDFDNKHAVLLNTAELTGIFHFPVGFVSAPKLKYLKAKDAPPPVELPKMGVLLGRSSYRGEETDVRITRDDRRRHLYVVGQTGTGKSYFMQNMARQDIEAGEGVCLIDPHGEMVEEILGWIPKERMDDVIVFDPGNIERPLGLNMLEYDSARPEQKTLIINELLGIFNKLFDMSVAGGPMFEQYFRNAAMLVMDDPASGNTLLEIGRVLADKTFREYKLSRSQNPVVKSFWKDVAEKAGGEASLQNMVPYITSKFDTFLTNEIMRPIIMQERSAINFRKVMDEGKILLVNLSKGRLGDINAYLLGLIIIGRLSIAALSRGDMPEEKRRDFYLYIDEFQNVTTDSIATILSEARKYRLVMIMAHQFIAQLAENVKKAVFGNVGSMVSFRIGAEDAELMAKQYEPVFSAQDLMNVENQNAFVKLLINGQTSRPFNIHTVVAPKADPSVAAAVKKLSAEKYGRPKAEVEAEIQKKYI
ncbi:MAG: DUF87 domain-containing protein [Patescibacteria group bacterium]